MNPNSRRVGRRLIATCLRPSCRRRIAKLSPQVTLLAIELLQLALNDAATEGAMSDLQRIMRRVARAQPQQRGFGEIGDLRHEHLIRDLYGF